MTCVFFPGRYSYTVIKPSLMRLSITKTHPPFKTPRQSHFWDHSYCSTLSTVSLNLVHAQFSTLHRTLKSRMQYRGQISSLPLFTALLVWQSEIALASLLPCHLLEHMLVCKWNHTNFSITNMIPFLD